MDNLDNILDHLSKQEPQLTDADLLCDSIMDQLPEQPRQESLWIGIARWSASIAAMFLLALFVGQNLEMESPTESAAPASYADNYLNEYGSTLKQVTSLPAALHQIAAQKETSISVLNIKRHYADFQQ